ncbi:hypothetical protein EDB80DRAFT_708043 [Ilyonectria destructans]|nr:hypothetical protein EDB80DRAFT_708043 [Ilyonectria destructans]
MVENRRAYSCSICPATFVRGAHLRRHERTHTEQRQFKCPFCQTGFTRSDSARRHSKTCARKNGQQIPSPLKRGRKFQACDPCALFRGACDRGQPCSGCVHRERTCTYSRIAGEQPESTPQQPSRDGISRKASASISSLNSNSTYPDTNSSCSLPLTQPKITRMSFLLRYTNPRNNTLQEYFNLSAASKESLSESTGSNQDLNSLEPGLPDSDVYGILDTWFWAHLEESGSFDVAENESLNSFLTPNTQSRTVRECTAQEEPSRQAHYKDCQVELRMTEIISALRSNSSDENSTEHVATVSKSAELIFAVDKVDEFVQLYFENWHRHCPMLHRPSFNLLTAFTPLITAVILVGAIYSSTESAEAARVCLNAAENYIFRHEAFRRLLDPPSRTTTILSIEPLQAGFIISIPQHWDHHRDSRHRVRLHRYVDLISASRHLGLPKLRHDNTNFDRGFPSDDSDHRVFIKDEEGIRLMTWIFLVDSSHTIFHRTPPRLTLSEMTGSLPCNEELFSTLNFEPQQKDLWVQSVSKIPSMEQGVRLLMGDEWGDNSASEFGQLNHLDLFILISALHEIIFNASVACTLSINKTPLERALSRWRLLWDLRIEQASSSHASSIGFFQHADEYWSLAKLMLEEQMPLAKESKGELDQDSMDEVNSFIKRFASMSV